MPRAGPADASSRKEGCGGWGLAQLSSVEIQASVVQAAARRIQAQAPPQQLRDLSTLATPQF